MQELKQLQSMLEQIKKDVWHIAKVSLPELKNAAGGGSDDRTQELEKQIAQNKADIAENSAKISECKTSLDTISTSLEKVNASLEGLQSSVNNVSTSVNTLSQDVIATKQTLSSVQSSIDAINATLEDHQNQINNIGASSGGEIIDVLYDMNSPDEKLNLGKTSGMVGGDSLSLDFSIYDKVIVHAGLNKCEASDTFYINSRNYTDISLHAASIALNQFFFMKAVINAAKTKFSVNYAGWYTMSTSTGEFTFARENGNASYFVHKIEGVR